ncbi:hypothetical protein [Leptotrichia hofstadii]|uniref:Uncharacterized protein n=1 Tax=Leptotrichia hofstadii F0254 TaxID=634994 RepID=C9N1C2_9FUSO|nr:hypothetical protein [Leptotrichia hofstadii]EEX73315.1 hypothetical protein GCWU000323_02643 [Leptotrichia hofstadii F0254]
MKENFENNTNSLWENINGIEFSKNEEIYDIIKNNLKNENEFKVDFGYTDGFHKSKANNKKISLFQMMIFQKTKQPFLMSLSILKTVLLTRLIMTMLFK